MGIKKRLFILCMSACTLLGMSSCQTEVNNDYTVPVANSIYFENGATKENELDPFKDLKVTFSGKPDKGTVEFDKSHCAEIIKENFDFTCEKNGKISNGESITIKAEYKKTAFEKAGYKINRDCKSYIVTGVDFYPRTLADYEKDNINSSVWKVAKKYIDDNIENIKLDFYSDKDHNNWSKSGSFKYDYTYYDVKMVYNVNTLKPSDNIYFIIFELKNDIECTASMDSTIKNAMSKGDTDCGIAYITVGIKSVTANSDKVFSFVEANDKDIVTNSFLTKQEAEQFCDYGGNYDTYKENFV